MSLRIKTARIVGGIIVAFVLLAYPILRAILLHSYAELDEHHVAENNARLSSAIEGTLADMNATAGDWAAWDDTYAFMQDRSSDYVESNLMDDTFATLRLSMMVYIDTLGNLMYGKAFDPEQEHEIALAFDPGLLPDSLRAQLLFGATQQGVLVLPSGPLLFAAHPILDSQREQPSRGTLIIGRYLDAAEWQRLSEMTHLNIQAQPLDQDDLPSEYAEARQRLEGAPYYAHILDAHRIAGYSFVRDVSDQPVIITRIDAPREMYRQGRVSLAYLSLALLLMGVLFMAAHIILLQRQIVAPIAQLSADVQRIGELAEPGQRLNRSGNDEVAGLARAIDHMLEQIERSQQAHDETEARYRALFDQAADSILLLDPRTPNGPTIIDANAAACAIHGYTREEMIGMAVAQLDAPDDREHIPDRAQRLLVGEALTFEARHLAKDGTVIPFEVSARLVEIGGRQVIQAIDRDISERARLEAQLRQAQKMEAVGQLAGGVAHDFNNILTVINGYTSLALSALDPSHPLYHDLKEVRDAGERAAGLTRQLLAFSRRQVLQLQAVNLNSVIEGMSRMLQRLLGERIRIETRFAPDLGNVRADASQIEQVVLNLAVNARDAMPDGGVLSIETANVTLDETYTEQHHGTKPGCYVTLTVSDNGCGMTADVKAHLFEPFFTTKGLAKGTGLGLATVYGIVKQSGGNIYVYSEPNRGTTFRTYLPRVDEATASAPSALPETVAAQQKELVLVVEDDTTVRTVAVRALEHLGYRTLLASNGREALALWEQRQEPIALVLTDVIMPEMNGPELAARLRAADPAVRIVYMSGYSDIAIGAGGLLGAAPGPGSLLYIQKPFSVATLAQKLAEALQQHTPPAGE